MSVEVMGFTFSRERTSWTVLVAPPGVVGGNFASEP
jgi:hypothetical protein